MTKTITRFASIRRGDKQLFIGSPFAADKPGQSKKEARAALTGAEIKRKRRSAKRVKGA